MRNLTSYWTSTNRKIFTGCWKSSTTSMNSKSRREKSSFLKLKITRNIFRWKTRRRKEERKKSKNSKKSSRTRTTAKAKNKKILIRSNRRMKESSTIYPNMPKLIQNLKKLFLRAGFSTIATSSQKHPKKYPRFNWKTKRTQLILEVQILLRTSQRIRILIRTTKA